MTCALSSFSLEHIEACSVIVQPVHRIALACCRKGLDPQANGHGTYADDQRVRQSPLVSLE